MNNKQNEWGVVYSGSKPEDFIAAWRHIHNIFQQEKATKVVWVFCPNVPEDANTPYNKIYPGDNYVDWVALDGYNWETTQSWSQWANFTGIFASSYKRLINIAPGKPMMIAEVNTTDQGGNKSNWYLNMFTKEVPYYFPKILAVVIFNEDRTKQEHINWKVDVRSDTLQTFIKGVHSNFY